MACTATVEFDFLKRRTRRKFPAVQIAVGYGAGPPPPPSPSSSPLFESSDRTHARENAVARGYALVRFGFSDLNQVDLSFPPDRPGIRLTVFPLSRTTRALLSHPYTYLILSLGPSTLLRAWRWNALRARLPLFRGLPFPFVPTRPDSARSTPNARRNRSTKYSWPACIVALEKRQARFRSSVLPLPHGTKSARSIWTDLLTVRFFKFGSDELCRFLSACLAYFKSVCIFVYVHLYGCLLGGRSMCVYIKS